MSPRVVEVDVLRGGALFGIAVVNAVGVAGVEGGSGPVYWAYETLLHQRFFPVFSVLFGVSFGLFLDAARERTESPRLVMLARLGFLVPFGAAHRLLQPDEVLLPYAVVGIVVLLPASFLPWRVVLVLGGVATVGAVLVGGGNTLIPGLFLVGFAAQRYGMGRLLETAARTRVAGACLVVAAVLDGWQVWTGSDDRAAVVAGLATAAAYMTGMLALLRRPGGQRALGRLAPVGRIALTGYVAATVMIVAGDRLLGPEYGTAMLLGTCVFAVEAAFGMFWLRRARYGPLEWVWRCLTWWRVVPNRLGGGGG